MHRPDPRAFHMTAEQHYLQAQHDLTSAEFAADRDTRDIHLAAAQIHATLATVSERDNTPAGHTHEEMLEENYYFRLGYNPAKFTSPPTI